MLDHICEMARRWRVLSLLGLVVLTGGFVVGCQDAAEENLEETGENIEEAGEEMGDAAEEATD